MSVPFWVVLFRVIALFLRCLDFFSVGHWTGFVMQIWQPYVRCVLTNSKHPLWINCAKKIYRISIDSTAISLCAFVICVFVSSISVHEYIKCLHAQMHRGPSEQSYILMLFDITVVCFSLHRPSGPTSALESTHTRIRCLDLYLPL